MAELWKVLTPEVGGDVAELLRLIEGSGFSPLRRSYGG